MAKKVKYSAAKALLDYLRDNSTRGYVHTSGDKTDANVATSPIVSANYSGADFSIASGTDGPVLTVGQKPSQAIEGSGTATHLYLCDGSNNINLVINVSSQVLSSGNTVTLNSFTVSAKQSAANA